MRASGLPTVLGVLAVLTAVPAIAQPQTPSEDNLGVRTEDGYRTTDPRYHPPQSNIGGGSAGAAVGQPGAGSAGAVAITNQLLNGALAGQPLLTPAQNPLIGRWRATGASAGTDLSSIGPLGQMSIGMLAGGCDSIFGRVVTFGPSSFEHAGADGRAQVTRNVEYHGNASTVAVLVRGSGIQPTILRLSDRNHAVSAMGCTFQRDGAAGPARPPGAQLANAPQPGPAAPSGPANATIRFLVGANSGGHLTGLANTPVWVMTQDPRAQLAATPFRPPPGTPVMKKLANDCLTLSLCQQEVGAMVKGALGRLMTDANGQAQTPQIASGRYWVVSVSNINGKPVVWALPLDVQPGANALSLDQLNGWSPL